MQALMGIQFLNFIEAIIRKRAMIPGVYRACLKEVTGISLVPLLSPDTKYNFAYMPMEVDEQEFGMSRNEL